MKRVTLPALCVVLCAAGPARASASSGAETDIRQIEEELRAAFVDADAATVDRLLPDDYTTTNVNGLTRTKAQLLADLKAGAVKTESLTLENIVVRVYGDAAVLTADRRSKSTLRGTDTSGHQRMI